MALLEPPATFLRLLQESVQDDDNKNTEDVLNYVAFLAAGMTEYKEFDADLWKDTLAPYVDDDAALIERFRTAAEREFSEEDDAESYGDEEEGVEELCDIRFNLAYGGKILLHQTKLRLLRGRRYALVGQNGVGKTTLMNAINNGKLEGWPQELKTAYVDSGSNVDPTYEAQIVLPYLIETTQRSKEDCVAKMEELDFTQEMMDGTIGALSGGWQMKLRLIRAGTTV